MCTSLAHIALDCLAAEKVDYGDVRIEHGLAENITVSADRPEVVRKAESSGYGIRVRLKGAWGFAAGNIMTRDGVIKTARTALRIARAGNKLSSESERYEPPPKQIANYTTPHQRDPFSVPIQEKLELLTQAAKALLKNKGVRLARGFADCSRKHKLFASTHGSNIRQVIITSGGGILAYAIEKGQIQQRSYPNTFRGNFATAGWEFVEDLDLHGNAPWVADEAAALLKAPPCPAIDNATLIIAPDQLALQIHESIGHPIELDRVFGQEASFAGASFLEPSMLGKFQYASPHVNVVADATAPKGLGTFAFDDEGAPAGRFPIIREGVLMNFLTSCGTAPLLDPPGQSNGASRAQGWQNIPLIRMTNINLEPGTWDFDDLVQDTTNGFLLETNKSWSIDDKRINFQFGMEVAREIKKGKIGRLFKNPVYTGITPHFWNSCDAVCNANYWQFYGTPNCGKGEPMQIMHVGHGTPPARFRGITLRTAQ